MKISTAARNTLADALDNLINTGAGTATLTIYSGSQPANPNTALSGNTALATFNLANPAFGTAASGAIALSGVPLSDAADATGTATFFRIVDRGGAAVVDGTVGTSGADLNLTTTSISTGVTVEITSLTITMPVGT